MNLFNFSIYLLLMILINFQEVLSDWEYPRVSINEGQFIPNEAGFAKIKSSNPTVIRYTLSGPGVTEPDFDNVIKFQIDEETGVITQLAQLDREKKDSYTLPIRALDANGNSAEKDNVLQITVSDLNDNDPVFDETSLIGSVMEGDNSQFMEVKADDADLSFNAKINFYIQPDTDIPKLEDGIGSRFAIDATSGKVNVVGELDYEKYHTYKFSVIAVDGGLKATEVYTQVTVNVKDSNDNKPEIEASSSKSLTELSPLNTPLFTLSASDADEGLNQEVYFEIIGGNPGGIFTIVSKPSQDSAIKSKGYLQLVKPLDYEKTKEYSLLIKAYNKKASNSQNDAFVSETTLHIKVLDENEPPEFVGTPYIGRAIEEEDITEKRPISVALKADDYDFNRNQTVTFSVDDPEGWFEVEKETGEISQIGRVDREASVVRNGTYELKVIATDNYDNGPHASRNGIVYVQITDINDNPPMPVLNKDELSVTICEKPVNKTIFIIEASDPDSVENGPPFHFRFDSTISGNDWQLKELTDTSNKVLAMKSNYDISGGSQTVELPFTISDNGSPANTGTATLLVKICKCSDKGDLDCKDAFAAGFPVAIIIAIIVILLLIIILVFALVAYKRRQAALVLKEPFFDDEDDIRENVQVYQEEGGEEDQEAYDLSALRAPLLEDPNQPIRIEKPLQQAPREPRGVPDDIGDYIGDAKDQADGDPSAPPFDSLLVFDYEGAGSDAGSLSSINTATTDGSVDYDYLNNWGPRFKKISDMYNDGSDSE